MLCTPQVLRIAGVLQQGKPSTVYAVVVGAGRYVNDFSGGAKRPNAKWMVDTSRGPNHGSLYLVAATSNGCGISSRSEIMTRYGLHHSFTDVKRPRIEDYLRVT